MPAQEQRTVAHYRLQETIGEGDRGVVYRAEDTQLRRPVALKFLLDRTQGGSQEQGFLREARSAAVRAP